MQIKGKKDEMQSMGDWEEDDGDLTYRTNYDRRGRRPAPP